jgi:hypothetical protein
VRATVVRAAWVGVLAVAAVGCGGADSAPGVASVGTATGGKATTAGAKKQSFEDAALAYSRCMRKQGVDVPDPRPGAGGALPIAPGGPGGGGSAKHQAAHRSCEALLRNADVPKPSEEDRARFEDALLKFVKCMRENGVDLPDPTFRNGQATQDLPGDLQDPTFQKAQKTCQQLLPKIGAPR